MFEEQTGFTPYARQNKNERKRLFVVMFTPMSASGNGDAILFKFSFVKSDKKKNRTRNR